MNEQTQRLQMFVLKPGLLAKLMDRKITLSGIPPDAEYVRGWHDGETNLLHMVFRHESFMEHYEGGPLYPHSLLVTEDHEAP